MDNSQSATLGGSIQAQLIQTTGSNGQPTYQVYAKCMWSVCE